MIPSCSMAGIAGSGGGGGSPTITLTNTTASKVGVGAQTATYKVDADGSVYTNSVFFENWISDPASAGLYQVRATLVSGDAPAGTLNAWTTLSSDQSWSKSNNASDGSEESCVLTVEIRDTATSTVRDTATITISATSLGF